MPQARDMSEERGTSTRIAAVTEDVVLSLKKPVVFHGLIEDWEVLKWGLDGWSTVFGNKEIPFRNGIRNCSSNPLWEGISATKEMALSQFFGLHRNSSDRMKGEKWYYFDYKRASEWLPSKALESVSWARFGFPDLGAKDATLWIGSRGAHTPCHFDTYGVNLVAQVFGTKRWILFPPSESKNLKPTRVPYEESSVYSMWNFSCPLPSHFYSGVKEVYVIELKAGDVLFVPQHWWHYVESLDLSISINTWIPTSLDDKCRLDEALVRFLMSQVSTQLDEEERQMLLNPNERDITSLDLHRMTDLIYMFKEASEPEVTEPPIKQQKLDGLTNQLCGIKNNAEFVPCVCASTLKTIMDPTCSCSSKEHHQTVMGQQDSSFSVSLGRVINAFCDPEVILKVRAKQEHIS